MDPGIAAAPNGGSMGDTLEKLKARQAKQAEAERVASEKRRVIEVKLRQEQKRIADAKAFTIGRALMAEIEEKPAITSMIREILDWRLTINRERALFDLKPLADDKDVTSKSEPPKMTLVEKKAEAAA
jgi:hypothetical protein